MAHATGTLRNAIVRWLARIGEFIARVPISLFLIAIITLLAILNGSLRHPTDPALIQRWGESWDNLARGRIINVPIADFIVLGRAHYIDTLILITCFTGLVEWLGGSILAALTFWPPSWTGSVATSILTKYLMTVANWHPPLPESVHVADVGASVGTWGSAGALIVLLYRFKPILGWLAGIGFPGGLLVRLAIHRNTSDIAHIFGITLGFLICRAYLAHTERTSPTAT